MQSDIKPKEKKKLVKVPGVLTVMQDGKVQMKVIAGSYGDRVIGLAMRIRDLGRIPTPEEAYKMARLLGLGLKEDLAVVTDTVTVFRGEDDLPVLFWALYCEPGVDPIWTGGKPEHSEIVEIAPP